MIDEETKKRRALFRPKRPELKEQCISCPFRVGNDAEFGEVVRKLREVQLMKKLTRPESIQRAVDQARAEVRRDVDQGGEFLCHHTVYDKDMKLQDLRNGRQCPGATRYFKTGELG